MYLILLSRAIVDVIRCLFRIRQYKNGENCIDGGNVKCTFFDVMLISINLPFTSLVAVICSCTPCCAGKKKTSQHHFNVHVLKSRRLVNKDNELIE